MDYERKSKGEEVMGWFSDLFRDKEAEGKETLRHLEQELGCKIDASYLPALPTPFGGKLRDGGWHLFMVECNGQLLHLSALSLFSYLFPSVSELGEYVRAHIDEWKRGVVLKDAQKWKEQQLLDEYLNHGKTKKRARKLQNEQIR